jgi:hypothetical protein
MAAIGDIILMVDADGATDINEFEKCVERVSFYPYPPNF